MQTRLTLTLVVRAEDVFVAAANGLAARLGLAAPLADLARCLNTFLALRGAPEGTSYRAIDSKLMGTDKARPFAQALPSQKVLHTVIELHVEDERAFRKAARRHAKTHADTRIIHPRHFLIPNLTTLSQCAEEMFVAAEDPPGTYVCSYIATEAGEAA